jgi:hypothetical protein
VDALQASLAALIETDTAQHDHASEDPLPVFTSVKRAALAAASGVDGAVTVASQPERFVPGLAEAWFC